VAVPIIWPWGKGFPHPDRDGNPIPLEVACDCEPWKRKIARKRIIMRVCDMLESWRDK
jgi:hypothetical protein